MSLPAPYFQIRNASLDDFAALYAMEEMCFEPPIRFTQQQMRGLMRRGRTLLATVDGVPAGFAIASVRGGRLRQRLGYIDTLEILAEHRGRGLARGLMETLHQSLAAEGVPAVLLHVAVGNERARALYVGLGYQWMQEQRGFYPDGQNALVLLKELQPPATGESAQG